jgi:hypothetical protein
VDDTIAVEAGPHSRKRLRRTPEEKRRIVEATFVPGASIARVARDHGVNANQVFQWRPARYGASEGYRLMMFQADQSLISPKCGESIKLALRTWPGAPPLDRPADEVTRFQPQLYFKGARDDIHAGAFGKVKNPVELVAFTSLLGYR